MFRMYGTDMIMVHRIDELVELVDDLGVVYLRFSAGPAADAVGQSIDGESGVPLPGLSVNRLTPEPWWPRQTREWLARQICQYAHLAAGDRYAWVLTGAETGRGPDSEPLVDEIIPVAVLDRAVLDEAVTVYREAFVPGRIPG